MKKNRMMRLASILLVCVLLTTSVISGTFAKYTTSVNSQDSARVAKWGFEPVTMDITDLFSNVYAMKDDPTEDSVVSTVDVIAPGTAGSAQFAFAYNEAKGINAPEVAYTFEVSTDGSSCADSIKNNKNIFWYLDDETCVNWDDLLTKIQSLDGSTEASAAAQYEPGKLPDGFGIADNTHTVSWKWTFENGDKGNAADTEMGNEYFTDAVTLKITVTATQVN